MSIELGLAVVAAVDSCLKIGKEVVRLCSACKHANEEVTERIIRVKACWLQINSQLEFLREAAPTLQPDHLSIHLEIAEVLDGKLKLTVTRLRSLFKEEETPKRSSASPKEDKTIRPRSNNVALQSAKAAEWSSAISDGAEPAVQLRPWKYAIFKEKLDASITELETWQKVFDPSWYLILRSAHNKPLQAKIEREIARPVVQDVTNARNTSVLLKAAPRRMLEGAKPHVFLPEDGFGALIKQNIPGSTASLGFRGSQAGRPYIIETFASPLNARSDLVAKNVREVAVHLTQMEPQAFGLLQCKGVVRHKRGESVSAPSFTFVFNIPDGCSEPRGLRQMLMDGLDKHSLSERFRLASELAKAVSFVHVVGFVHKNIRPETILLLKNGTSALGSAYLIGFERVRNADGHTFRLGEASWQKDLYHHPDRQGVVPEEAFVMQHDIYSLGVCLLEIGLWDSLIITERGKLDRPGNALGLPPQDADNVTPTWHSVEMKEHLVSLAEDELPAKMGSKYAEVVVTCLTCLDRGNLDFGDEEEFQDEDGIIVGVRFIEKVLMKLNELVV